MESSLSLLCLECLNVEPMKNIFTVQTVSKPLNFVFVSFIVYSKPEPS